MALVHELCEVFAGDITPADGVSPEKKARLERESLARVLGGLKEAEELFSLWEEFEAGKSPEARLIKQLDRLEMGIQAALYRAEGVPGMEEFLESADRAVGDGDLRSLLALAAGAGAGAAAGAVAHAGADEGASAGENVGVGDGAGRQVPRLDSRQE
ncbi:MAG: HD domain-containing protein, partial [Spirochaetaceae bacterium]|nr:HD domain-containing protein [Spirochaetaceae bacterium]